jgi:hypothetical protein
MRMDAAYLRSASFFGQVPNSASFFEDLRVATLFFFFVPPPASVFWEDL